MRIVLTVPEDILQEACTRIITFCKDHINLKSKEVNGHSGEHIIYDSSSLYVKEGIRTPASLFT